MNLTAESGVYLLAQAAGRPRMTVSQKNHPMKFPQRRQLFALSLLLGVIASQGARADDRVNGVVAVAAKVSGDYVRTKLPDGSFPTEYYAFGKGGHWGGEIRDDSIDKLQFEDVAHVIAGPLAARNYLPARDSKNTKLLIMVYWGTTAGPGPTSDSVAYDQLSAAQANTSGSDASLAQLSSAMTMVDVTNKMRDQIDFKNANMLGYDAPGTIGTDYGNHIRGGPLGVERQELIDEIELNRYFVVLMAYDFQIMLKQKKHKLLWETRFSINERHNSFDEALPMMAQYASRYFGHPTDGLLRNQVQEGQVEIGELKSLGEVAAPKK
jgi:hypothetical protein